MRFSIVVLLLVAFATSYAVQTTQYFYSYSISGNGWTQEHVNQLNILIEALKGCHGDWNCAAVREWIGRNAVNFNGVNWDDIKMGKSSGGISIQTRAVNGSGVGTVTESSSFSGSGWTQEQTDQLNLLFKYLKACNGNWDCADVRGWIVKYGGNFNGVNWDDVRAGKTSGGVTIRVTRNSQVTGKKQFKFNTGWTQEQTDQLNILFKLLQNSNGDWNSADVQNWFVKYGVNFSGVNWEDVKAGKTSGGVTINITQQDDQTNGNTVINFAGHNQYKDLYQILKSRNFNWDDKIVRMWIVKHSSEFPNTNWEQVITTNGQGIDWEKLIGEKVNIPAPVIQVPVNKPVAQPVVKPVVQPVVKPVLPLVRPARPVIKPAVQPVIQPVVQPVVKPVEEKPVVQPVAKPVRPLIKPAVQPAVQPVVKPVVEKPLVQPAVKTVVEKPLVQPVVKPARPVRIPDRLVKPAVMPVRQTTVVNNEGLDELRALLKANNNDWSSSIVRQWIVQHGAEYPTVNWELVTLKKYQNIDLNHLISKQNKVVSGGTKVVVKQDTDKVKKSEKGKVVDNVNTVKDKKIIKTDGDKMRIADGDKMRIADGDKMRIADGDKKIIADGDKKRIADGDKKRIADGDKKRIADGDKKRIADGDKKRAKPDDDKRVKIDNEIKEQVQLTVKQKEVDIDIKNKDKVKHNGHIKIQIIDDKEDKKTIKKIMEKKDKLDVKLDKKKTKDSDISSGTYECKFKQIKKLKDILKAQNNDWSSTEVQQWITKYGSKYPSVNWQLITTNKGEGFDWKSLYGTGKDVNVKVTRIQHLKELKNILQTNNNDWESSVVQQWITKYGTDYPTVNWQLITTNHGEGFDWSKYFSHRTCGTYHDISGSGLQNALIIKDNGELTELRNLLTRNNNNWNGVTIREWVVKNGNHYPTVNWEQIISNNGANIDWAKVFGHQYQFYKVYPDIKNNIQTTVHRPAITSKGGSTQVHTTSIQRPVTSSGSTTVTGGSTQVHTTSIQRPVTSSGSTTVTGGSTQVHTTSIRRPVTSSGSTTVISQQQIGSSTGPGQGSIGGITSGGSSYSSSTSSSSNTRRRAPGNEAPGSSAPPA